MSEKLEIIISAKDQASGPVRGLQGALGGLGKAASVGLKAAAGIGIGAIVGIGAATVKSVASAGNAAEMLSKYGVVFGKFGDQVEKNLTGFARAAGRSKYDLMEMAAGVQDTFVPLGFARDKAAGLSEQLVKLAVDVGSFNNEASPAVMEAFKSALVGNHEAVRRFGIVINQSTLEQELFNMGIEGGLAAATDQEKVVARLNLLYSMTADAQGDAIETSGSWTNLMVRLKAIIGDTSKAIGLKLLPVLTPFLQKIATFVQTAAPKFVDWITEDVIPAVIDWASAMSSKLAPAWGWITGTAVPAMQSLGATISGYLTPAITWVTETALPAYLKVWKLVWGWIIDTAIPTVKEWAETVGTTLTGAWDWFTTNILPAIQAAGQTVYDWIVGTAIPKLEEWAGVVTDTLSKAWETFTTVTIPAIKTEATKVYSWIIGTAIPKVQEWAGAVSVTLTNAFNTFKDATLPAFQTEVNRILGEIDFAGFWDGLVSDEGTIDEKVQTAAGFLIASFDTWANSEDTQAQMEEIGGMVAQGLMDGIVLGIKALFSKETLGGLGIVAGFTIVGATIRNDLNNIGISLASGFILTLFSHFQTFLGREISPAIRFGLIAGIRAGVESAYLVASLQWVQLAIRLFNDFITSLKAVIEETDWQAIMDSIADWLSTAAENIGSTLSGIGESMIDGIKSGVEAKAGELAAACMRVVNDALALVTFDQGAKSPATKWIPLGISIAQGVAQGIEDSSTFISDAGRTVLDRSFKSWLEFMKLNLGKGSGELRQMLWKLTDKTLNHLVVRSGQTAAQAMKQALDQIITQVSGFNTTIARYLKGNQGTLFEMLGEQAGTVVGFGGGEKFASLMSAAGVFGGLAGTAASLLQERRLGPIQETIRGLEEQLALMREQGASLEDQAKVVKVLREERQKAKGIETDLARLARQQADLQFIQQQSNLIQMIKDNGLNVKNILGGLKLGLDADLQGLIQAMTRAMQAMIGAAEKELGIASPSRKGFALGRNFIEAMGIGALEAVPATAMAMGGAAGQVTNIKNYYFEPHYSTRQSPSSLMHDIAVLRVLEA